MANISFILNNSRKFDNETPQKVYLRYRLGLGSGKKIDFSSSLGFTINVKDWDKTKQVVKNRSHIIDRNEINNLINNLKSHFIKFENKNKENGFIPNYKDVRIHFDSYFKISDTEITKDFTLLSFIDFFIENAKTKPNAITKKLVVYNTLKDYTLTKNTLQNFNDEVYKIDFETINLSWYYDFIDWCNKKGFKMNYVGKHIKTLKTFMNSAFEFGYTNNIEFKNRKFSVFKENSDNVYLKEEELKKMWQLDLTKTPQKENARDLFLIGAYTGLRISDFNSLTENNIVTENGVKLLLVRTQKTNKEVAVPLHPIVQLILNKNDGKPPKKISDQKLNLYIKQVAKEIKLNEIVELNFYKGGKNITVNKPKHELISSHTARRSFCSNAYLSGMDSMDIMAISGHTTIKNFLLYIKISTKERAVKMSEHPFFNNSNHLKVV